MSLIVYTRCPREKRAFVPSIRATPSLRLRPDVYDYVQIGTRGPSWRSTCSIAC